MQPMFEKVDILTMDTPMGIMSTPTHAPRPVSNDQLRDGKRRSSQACSTCRSRKIRCDMLQTGLPCSRCRLDRFDCVAEPRKKRGKRAGSNANRSRSACVMDEERQPNSLPSDGQDQPSPTSVASIRTLPKHSILHQVPYSPFLLEFADVRLDRDAEPQTFTAENTRAETTNLGPDAFESGDHGEDDLAFLRQKGAFDIPQRHVMDQFVSSYFKVFHPFFPVIDKEDFLRSYDNMKEPSQHSLSLLLLQSVLFVASSYVPPELLTEAGFSTRKKARQVIHKRAKFLYNFEYESNDLVNIQALLLLSHHYSSMLDQKHTWHWVYQAIGLAQGAGLHKDPGEVPQRRFWARIWWACLVRDRLISLGTNRPMHINSLDCTVRMLTLQDLEENGDGDEERAIKEIFLEFVKICQYMEGVMSLQHTSAVAGKILPDEVRVCENTLQHWLDNLTSEARRQDESIVHSSRTGVAILYRTVLHLIYNTVVIALNQCSVPGITEGSYSRIARQDKIQTAAADSTQLVAQLVNFDLVKYCPTICVTAVLPPLIIHLLGIRASTSAPVKQLHTHRYNMCMMFLEQLGDIYWHASIYHDFFELALSVRATSTKSLSSAGDPLVAFLQRQMMLRKNGPSGHKRAYIEATDAASHDEGLSTALRAMQEQNLQSNQGSSATTESRHLISPGQTPEMMDPEAYSAQDVRFEEWIDFGNGFHSIFPAA